MNYYLDLFTPETAQMFEKSPQNISGFRISRKSYISNRKIGPGDKFVCYLVRLQRFIGILEITSEPFVDYTPIFQEKDDPFVLRFKVKPTVWLPMEKAVPIKNDILWQKLSFTKGLEKNNNKWTHLVFTSPFKWDKDDCEYIEHILTEQKKNPKEYPFDENDVKKLKIHKIIIGDNKQVTVSVPDDTEENEMDGIEIKVEKRESLKVQAMLAEIGEKLGMKVWLPANDRTAVLDMWKPQSEVLLTDLPFSFDEVTLKTIKNIDVLWIKGRTIIRAFEVEGTTSIYSGILRMADLLSLLPNLDVKIHIVAPLKRRDEVFKQISRPVFSVMESGPLSEICSYISYDSVKDLAKEPKLQHMAPSIIDEYSECEGQV